MLLEVCNIHNNVFNLDDSTLPSLLLLLACSMPYISKLSIWSICYLILAPIKQTKVTKHLQTRKRFLLFVISKINCDFKFGGLATSCVEVFPAHHRSLESSLSSECVRGRMLPNLVVL